MIYRAFRHKASGAWLGTLMTSDGDEFRTSPGQHLADALAAYQSHGWGPADFEVVDCVGENPRGGSIIEPDPVPVDPDAVRLEELHGKLAGGSLTVAQVSEMLRLERGL